MGQKGFMSIELHFLVSHNFHTDICLEVFCNVRRSPTFRMHSQSHLQPHLQSHMQSHLQSHLQSHFQSHLICVSFSFASHLRFHSFLITLAIISHVTHSPRKQTTRNSHSHTSRSTLAMFSPSPVCYYLCAFLITCLQVLASTKNSVRYYLLRFLITRWAGIPSYEGYMFILVLSPSVALLAPKILGRLGFGALWRHLRCVAWAPKVWVSATPPVPRPW
ncbi:hypothetical protein B0H13DRAFT_442990 [Mycena leptocephala]|nr:hypothetical protein B0H13DRAFT_442990 [Mycena leptocephala]